MSDDTNIKKVKLQISGYDDRRNLVGILADNGYKVNIEKEKHGISEKHLVIIHLDEEE